VHLDWPLVFPSQVASPTQSPVKQETGWTPESVLTHAENIASTRTQSPELVLLTSERVELGVGWRYKQHCQLLSLCSISG